MPNRHGSRDVIVALTAAGRPQSEVADAAGISVRTLRRRLEEPDLVSAVAAATLELERQAVGQLSDLRARAFSRLGALLADDDPGITLRACKLILDAGLAHRSALADDRLGYLEIRVAEFVRDQRAGDNR